MKTDIRIAIADDHKLMLEGLATLIGSIPGFQLLIKAASGKDLAEALAKAPTLPDVCIVDIEMPGMDGIETVKVIREKHPQVKVMALTMHSEPHFVNRMIAAGASGYLLKNVDREVFASSIRRIANGEDFVTEGFTITRGSPGDEILSQREKQVLKLIVQGKSNKEIADELFISDRTADTHRTNIKRKLKLTSLSQLIQYAREHGLS